MEIKVNVPRPGLEPQHITINLPPRTKEEKNNLLSLSDKDLAQMDPEKLEQVRRAKENLIEIMKADREVQAMMSEEQFAALVSEKMNETGVSQEDAELLVKRDQGLLGRNRPTFAPPAEDALTKALRDGVAERIKEVFFSSPKGGGGEDKGKGPDLAQTLKTAQERGVQSLFLPDGTEISLNPKDTFGDELMKDALNWGKEKLLAVVKGEGGGVGNLSPELLTVQNPETLKILLEDKARTEEIEATKIIAKSKSDATMAIAMFAATLISPEGYKKVKDTFELVGKMGKGELGGGKGEKQPAETPPPAGDKFVSMVCLNTECNHVQVIQRGTAKYNCEKCGSENIVDWE